MYFLIGPVSHVIWLCQYDGPPSPSGMVGLGGPTYKNKRREVLDPNSKARDLRCYLHPAVLQLLDLELVQRRVRSLIAAACRLDRTCTACCLLG
jgi:hypothetical protein